jgi:hypothetical protein
MDILSVSSVNYEKMLAELTSTSEKDWSSIDGPETGVGEDYWYTNAKTRQEVYINNDQGFVVVEMDGELMIECNEDDPWFNNFKTKENERTKPRSMHLSDK